MKATTVRLNAHLRRMAKRVYVCPVGDDLWFTDTFIACRVDKDHLVAELLAEYNLPLEPMVCTVDRTIVREFADDVPDVAKFIVKPNPNHTLTRYTIGGAPISTSNGELWVTSEGTFATFDPERRRWVDLLAPEGEWRHDARRPVEGPAVKVDGDGNPVALLMPVRTLLTGLTADEAKP